MAKRNTHMALQYTTRPLIERHSTGCHIALDDSCTGRIGPALHKPHCTPAHVTLGVHTECPLATLLLGRTYPKDTQVKPISGSMQ